MTEPIETAHLDTPLATYRIQFSGAFTFDDARHLVPYLSQLGISHVYASPYFKARPGIEHVGRDLYHSLQQREQDKAGQRGPARQGTYQ